MTSDAVMNQTPRAVAVQMCARPTDALVIRRAVAAMTNHRVPGGLEIVLLVGTTIDRRR